jgi:hypothetical protein
MMNDLAEFLLARIAEDEAEIAAGADFAVLDTSGWMGHAALWGQERALAECSAKRDIVTELVDEHVTQRWTDARPTVRRSVRYPAVLQALARPYADHPDYRQEWRP